MCLSKIIMSDTFHNDKTLSRVYFKLGSFETDKDEPILGIETSFSMIKKEYKFVFELVDLLDNNEVEYTIYPVLYLGNFGNRIDFILPIINAQQAVLIKIKFPFLDLRSPEQKIDNKVLEDNANLLW